MTGWPRMSCYFTMSMADQECADHLGYATYCTAPESVRNRGHRPGADLLWRNICGRRGETAVVRLIENAGFKPSWWQLGTIEQAVSRKNDPDIVFEGLPLQSKANDYSRDRILFYVREDKIVRNHIFILTSLARFPFCEIVGWVWGHSLMTHGTPGNHEVLGRVLNPSHPSVRDFFELLNHPQRIRQEPNSA